MTTEKTSPTRKAIEAGVCYELARAYQVYKLDLTESAHRRYLKALNHNYSSKAAQDWARNILIEAFK